MIKQILVIITLVFAFLILLAFNLFNYFHFQILADQQQNQIKHIESLLTANQTSIRELNLTQLTGKGVYMNGECVPAPACPVDYQPEIYVMPISTLVMDTSKQQKSSPSSNFSAFAIGKFHDVLSPPSLPNTVSDCTRTQAEPCTNRYGTVNEKNKFWRVCLYFDKQNQQTNSTKKQPDTTEVAQGMVAAFTQCVKKSPPAKSNFQGIPDQIVHVSKR